jgi:hypothetical protein
MANAVSSLLLSLQESWSAVGETALTARSVGAAGGEGGVPALASLDQAETARSVVARTRYE